MAEDKTTQELKKIGLTDDEIRCFELTIELWNRMLALPAERNIAQPIVHAAVVSLQQTLLVRPALRLLNPDEQPLSAN